MGKKLLPGFYRREQVTEIARELIGKVIFTRMNGEITAGKITEAEAYSGMVDKASHAFQNKKTNRTAIMFDPGGRAYVYLCYGIHRLFNITANVEGKPDAILIRAIEPLTGINTIMKRRGLTSLSRRLGTGPGVVSEALGIEMHHYGEPLDGDTIWIEDHYLPVNEVVVTKRVGVDYAEEDALLPWRFYEKGSDWVSVR